MKCGFSNTRDKIMEQIILREHYQINLLPRINCLKLFDQVWTRPGLVVGRRSDGVQRTIKKKRKTKETWLETTTNDLRYVI